MNKSVHVFVLSDHPSHSTFPTTRNFNPLATKILHESVCTARLQSAVNFILDLRADLIGSKKNRQARVRPPVIVLAILRESHCNLDATRTSKKASQGRILLCSNMKLSWKTMEEEEGAELTTEIQCSVQYSRIQYKLNCIIASLMKGELNGSQ